MIAPAMRNRPRSWALAGLVAVAVAGCGRPPYTFTQTLVARAEAGPVLVVLDHSRIDWISTVDVATGERSQRGPLGSGGKSVGSYTPSSSRISVLARAQISSSRCQSALFLASLETSSPITMPARPSPTSVTSRRNPSRHAADAPDSPWSESITTMRSSDQPSAVARERRAPGRPRAASRRGVRGRGSSPVVGAPAKAGARQPVSNVSRHLQAEQVLPRKESIHGKPISCASWGDSRGEA